MKKKGTYCTSLSMPIMIIVLISSIGCVEPTDVNADAKQSFSITDIQVNTGLLDGCHWFINVTDESGFFIESYEIDENKTTIKPDIILQLQTLLYLMRSTSQDEQVLILIDKQMNYYSSFQNRTDNLSYQDSMNSSEIAQTALTIRLIEQSLIHNVYQNLSMESIETLKQHINDQINQNDFKNCSATSFKHICLTLSSMIEINQNINNTFDNDTLFFIYEMLHDRLKISEYDPDYVELIPWFTQTIYGLYGYTNNISFAQKHIELNNKLLPIQNIKNISRRGHFFVESHDQIDAAYTAICIKSIIQAYQLTDVVENNTLKASFEPAVFMGIYALSNMQENTIKHPFIYGGVYTDNNQDHIRLNSTLYTLQSFKQIKDLYQNSSWNYISDGIQGYLSIKEESQNQNILWYLLSLGVFISITFLVILYFILSFIRKRKNR